MALVSALSLELLHLTGHQVKRICLIWFTMKRERTHHDRFFENNGCRIGCSKGDQYGTRLKIQNAFIKSSFSKSFWIWDNGRFESSVIRSFVGCCIFTASNSCSEIWFILSVAIKKTWQMIFGLYAFFTVWNTLAAMFISWDEQIIASDTEYWHKIPY